MGPFCEGVHVFDQFKYLRYFYSSRTWNNSSVGEPFNDAFN